VKKTVLYTLLTLIADSGLLAQEPFPIVLYEEVGRLTTSQADNYGKNLRVLLRGSESEFQLWLPRTATIDPALCDSPAEVGMIYLDSDASSNSDFICFCLSSGWKCLGPQAGLPQGATGAALLGAGAKDPEYSSTLFVTDTSKTMRLTPVAAAPTCDTNGTFYTDSTANEAFYCDGTSWSSIVSGDLPQGTAGS
jgi:hypothetical protein